MIKKIITAAIVLSLLMLSACETGENQNFSMAESNQSQSSPQHSIPESSVPENINIADLSEMDFTFSNRDTQNGYEESEISTPEDKGDYYEITSEGTYIFSGDIIDKAIIINAGENHKIQIVLDNANLSNSNGPCINIQSADKVFITLAHNSINTVSDGTSREDETIDAAVFSRADLTINGTGKLAVTGNYKHGIVSKDDLVIANGILDVTAANVGLNGKDCVKVSNADINITAGSDGIRSDNDEDSDRGFVYIQSGKININAKNDGIQAETAVKITTSEMNITSGNGSSQSLSDSSESYKGIKAAWDIIIENGNFNIDSTDDCIHSNNTIVITGGNFNLSSGDDGIHADNDLSVSAGEINIKKSYEGLESSRIFITGGNIRITASDDGLNAAGGNDQSSMGGRPGMGGFDNGVGEVVISGGYLIVDSSGDGLDSNGTLAITGGIVLVSGPTNNGNGAFDYGRSASVTGGVLVALGSSGMATGFTQAENQGAILYNFTFQSAGTSFALCDKNGNAILSFTPKKSYSSAVVTAPEMVQGGDYKIVVGGNVSNTDENGFAQNQTIDGGTTLAEITLNSLIYNAGGFGGGDHGGGPGGQMPPDGFGGTTPPDGFGGTTPPDGFGGTTPPDGFGTTIPPDGFGGGGYRP